MSRDRLLKSGLRMQKVTYAITGNMLLFKSVPTITEDKLQPGVFITLMIDHARIFMGSFAKEPHIMSLGA